MRNGGLLDITDLAKEAGLSRPTVMSHLDAMEIAHAIVRLPPFHGGGTREIVRRPRVFACDTGLVAHVRGWERIREEDRGLLWENLVLDELRTTCRPHTLRYWRDKTGREVDLVVESRHGRVHAIEAKVNPDAFTSDNLRAFRDLYPHGRNLLVCPFVTQPYTIKRQSLAIDVCATTHLPCDL